MSDTGMDTATTQGKKLGMEVTATTEVITVERRLVMSDTDMDTATTQGKRLAMEVTATVGTVTKLHLLADTLVLLNVDSLLLSH
jgi:hypothetical protein